MQGKILGLLCTILCAGALACSVEPDEDAVSDESAAVTSHPSFETSCKPPFSLNYNEDRSAIVFASSNSCEKRDGTWGGRTTFLGSCTTDVANCNGNLTCGRCL